MEATLLLSPLLLLLSHQACVRRLPIQKQWTDVNQRLPDSPLSVAYPLGILCGTLLGVEKPS